MQGIAAGDSADQISGLWVSRLASNAARYAADLNLFLNGIYR